MTAVSSQRVRDDITRVAHEAGDVPAFARGAARVLARSVGFDGVCLLTMDPATSLPTGEVVENGLPPAATARMANIEFGDGDVNTFDALARSGRRVGRLSEATGGELNRSQRHREVRAPNGFGDELRAVLVDDAAPWGALTLLRGDDRHDFSAGDAALVASVVRELAEGLRRAIVIGALTAERDDRDAAAGVALLAPDDSIVRADPAGRAWLAELCAGRAEPLPDVVIAVARRARSIAQGRAEPGAIAGARVRGASAGWLVVRASTLGADADAQTVVTFEPARAHELAPLIAAAYELTERERAITQLVARGLSTSALAARLHLSPWTVQDHLKSIFDKVGVGTRGELVARIFFEHYAPRLRDGAAIGCDGWFAAPAPADPLSA